MRVRYIIALLAVAALLYLSLWPTGRTFESFEVEPSLALPNTLPQNLPLDSLRDFGTVGEGPEDIAVDVAGKLYTGIADGHVMTFTPGEKTWRALTVTYGRPLGLAFSPDERWLYIADAEKGLMRTDKQGHLERLVDTLAGEDLGLVDDLAVAPDGRVYFTAATREFGVDEFREALLTHHGTGQLLRYDPKTQTLDVLLDGLQFANGVAIDAAGEYVYVAETGNYRVLRTPLNALRLPREPEVFVERLPGFPDGLSFDDQGQLWVAIVAPRSDLLDALGPHPSLREAIYRLPQRFKSGANQTVSLALALDHDGNIADALRGSNEAAPGITNLVWRGDTVYVGSLFGRRVKWGVL